MTEKQIEEYIGKWKEENSLNGGKLIRDCIDVNEIYKSELVNINQSYHQCIISSADSITGAPCVLFYSSIDLIEIDELGEIIGINSVYYQILK